jgi:tetratricopeptide (TPR) repeat protein
MTTDEGNTAEFTRLLERWQTIDDPEEQIAALEAALKLEPKLSRWPSHDSREQVMGKLLNGLGDSYQMRRKGSRAENLERAIKAYEEALRIRTREGFSARLGANAE